MYQGRFDKIDSIKRSGKLSNENLQPLLIPGQTLGISDPLNVKCRPGKLLTISTESKHLFLNSQKDYSRDETEFK